jgi:hypothetical protein
MIPLHQVWILLNLYFLSIEIENIFFSPWLEIPFGIFAKVAQYTGILLRHN